MGEKEHMLGIKTRNLRTIKLLYTRGANGTQSGYVTGKSYG